MYEAEYSTAARALAREVNIQIHRVAVRFDSTEGQFLCECGRGDCAVRVRLRLADFEGIQDAGHFVVVDGHELADHVVERRERYVVADAGLTAV